MAVRMMTVKENATETITNYPGCETTRISHHYSCPNKSNPNFIFAKSPDCPNCSFYEPIYMQTLYQGCVLDVYEHNGHEDSDFYAIVWDKEKIKHIQYATTRGWSYPNSATVDATQEVIDKATTYVRNQRLLKWQEDNKRQAEMPYKNRVVKVISGRKIKIGTVATVFWFGEDTFKATERNRYNKHNPYAGLVGKFYKDRYRVGLQYGDKKEFTSAANVEVVNPENYLELEYVEESSSVGWRNYELE